MQHTFNSLYPATRTAAGLENDRTTLRLGLAARGCAAQSEPAEILRWIDDGGPVGRD